MESSLVYVPVGPVYSGLGQSSAQKSPIRSSLQWSPLCSEPIQCTEQCSLARSAAGPTLVQ
eukprot:10211972-Lingulodinium_polyedra.AAC.1